jgi:hypothetical protein
MYHIKVQIKAIYDFMQIKNKSAVVHKVQPPIILQNTMTESLINLLRQQQARR